jgi:hypothetical protein
MKKLLSIGLIFISLTTFAKSSPTAPDYSMPSLEVGFKSNTVSIQSSTSNTQVTGYQLGVSGVLNFSEKFGLKTGLFYTERPFKAEFSGATVDGKVTYFEIPAFLMYKIEDYAGVYAGPSLGIKLGDEGSPALTSVKSMVVPLTIGAQFKFLPNVGLNFFFEGAGQLATGVENSRAVGINLMFVLD